jgi:hypothetical protein
MHRQHAILSIAGGVMWVAFASMATSAVMGIMRTTREGAGIMNKFDRSVGQLTKSFSTAFVKVLGPAIQMLTKLFDIISKLPMPVLTAMAAIIITGLSLLTLKGISMILSGGLTYLGITLFKTAASTNQVTLAATGSIPAIWGMKTATDSLGKSLINSLMIFSTFIMMGMTFKGVSGIVVAGIGAIIAALTLYKLHLLGAITLQGMLTPWGIAAMAGAGLAIGAIAGQFINAQVGTRKVQRTGPAFVHAGEMIGTERGLKAQMGGKGGSPDKQQINATINFSGNIQTKADKEELRPLILKVIKEALDNKA